MGLYDWLFGSPMTPKTRQSKMPKRGRGRPRTTPMMSCERRAFTEGTRHVAPSINKPAGAKNVYIDGEWNSLTKPQKFYLLGYCFDEKHAGWLYDENDYTYMGKTLYRLPYRGKNMLTRRHVLELFEGVDNIYFYGPDIGMLEKCFGINLRERYNCINLLAATKKLEPNAKSHKLVEYEHQAGIYRETEGYKHNSIFNVHRDWYTDPRHRARVLLYNKEDVINLLKVKKFIYKKYRVTKKQEQNWKL